MRLRGSFGFACALLVVVTGAKDDVVDYAAYDAPVEEVQRPASRIRPAARGTKLVDEVEEDARAASKADKNGEDDYSEFANKQPANGGANHELKQVTLSPEKTTYRLPPVPEEAQKKRPDPAVDRVPRPTIPAIVQPRKGYFYQHYPWDRLPRAFNLNPGLQYTYPTQFQNAAWSYPTHTLDYKGYGWYGNVNQHLQRQQQEYAYQQQYREYYNQALYHRQYGTNQPGYGGYGGYGDGGCGGEGCGGGGGGCGGGSAGGCARNEDEDNNEDSDDSFRTKKTTHRIFRRRNHAI